VTKQTADIDLDDINEHVARDDEAKTAGAAEERAAVVTWLRERAKSMPGWTEHREIDACAELIKRGEHRR